jgi:predicted TIM-barrel fold metal-dependent hydrolase
MSEIPAIDADGHILEVQDEIRPYLDSKWRNRMTNLWPDAYPWDTSLQGKIKPPMDYKRGLNAKQQVEIWNRILEKHEIEQAVLFPTGAGNAEKLQEPEFAKAVVRAINDHFANDYKTERLHPMGALTMRDPDAAAREIERAVKQLGLKGFEILPDGRPLALGDPFYDPIYEVAQDCGAVIGVHGTRHWSHEWGANKFSTFAEVHAFAFPAGVIANFTSVMCHGLTLRFPKLKIAFLEIGASWLPYYLDRLDEHWEKRADEEMPLLVGTKPSDIFRQSKIKVSIEGKESLLRETADFVGIDHLIYATDVPHWDGEFPENIEEIRETNILSDDEKKALLRDNAAELFSLN